MAALNVHVMNLIAPLPTKRWTARWQSSEQHGKSPIPRCGKLLFVGVHTCLQPEKSELGKVLHIQREKGPCVGTQKLLSSQANRDSPCSPQHAVWNPYRPLLRITESVCGIASVLTKGCAFSVHWLPCPQGAARTPFPAAPTGSSCIRMNEPTWASGWFRRKKKTQKE